VACANVAGLLTSRAPARAGEIALRLAIGAGRGRLIRQLLVENFLLAAGGGLAGVAVGYLGILLWRQVSVQSTLPVELVFQMDGRVLTVSLAVAVLSVFLFGLTPAIQASRVSLTGALRSTGWGLAGRSGWGRRVLVMGQAALSLVLIAVAGFMYTSFLRQLARGPGVRTDHLLTMSFNPGLSRYSQDQTLRFYDRLVERARDVRGVESVAIASFIPMSGSGPGRTPIRPEGYQFPAGTDSDNVATNHVDPDFFDVMGISLAQGRGFNVTDTAETPRVAIVNQQLADRYWPNGSALGKRFRVDEGGDSWVEIVGVVPTGRYFGISESPTSFLYLPYAQHPQGRMTLVARSSADPLGLVEPLREVVRDLDVGLAVMGTRTMENLYFDGAVRNFLVVMRAIAAMGVMGVTLTFVGLYGLVASDVSRRTREIGIRMAVGASQGTVLRMMLTHGLRLAVIGLAVGLVMTVGVGQAMRAAFPGGGGDERGLLIYVQVTGALLAITALAAYLPARRAARIAPTEALRCE
jgi:predicted permease